MQTTEQNLATAIEQLSLLSGERPASLDDLIALNKARDCVEELFRALRRGAQRGPGDQRPVVCRSFCGEAVAQQLPAVEQARASRRAPR
jgi:hypothetical protein